MKNREFVKSMTIYDLFMRVRKNTDSCPIYAITRERGLCDRCNRYRIQCEMCFAYWLNETYKGGKY